jgi:hypothetical protein
MTPLLDCSPASMGRFTNILGVECWQLQTPLTRYGNWGGKWAADNGGYTRQNWPAYRRMLAAKLPFASQALWATVPDVPGCARRTMELFDQFKAKIADMGYPLALVAQNGIEDMQIPWDDIGAVFIGGRDGWRESEHVRHLVAAAKWLGKHVHVGRVNTPERYKYFAGLGVDTCDGSGIVRYSGAMTGKLSNVIRNTTPALGVDFTGSEKEPARTAEQPLLFA